MSNVQNLSVQEFLAKVASMEATPGGGAVAAFGASLSAALLVMVAKLTIGKKGYETVQQQIQELQNVAEKLQTESLSLVDQDIESFNNVMAAYKLPKEQENRKEKIQEALKSAVETPYKVVQICNQLISLAENAAKLGNKNAYSDAMSARHFAQSAKKSAIENIQINLPSITDENWKKTIVY